MTRHLTNRQILQHLTRQRQIAIIWSSEDVQAQRPDLSRDQAWEVLLECERVHDAELGFTWLLIETVAEELFPRPCHATEDDEETLS